MVSPGPICLGLVLPDVFGVVRFVIVVRLGLVPLKNCQYWGFLLLSLFGGISHPLPFLDEEYAGSVWWAKPAL